MKSSPSAERQAPEEVVASTAQTAASTETGVNDTSDETRSDVVACANCGADLQGTYCAVCGQRAAHRIVPLWQVTNEFLEDLVDLDLRILHTFPTFFFRPGALTVEYVRGRRRRYIRPLRLYLFSSFLLFTVLAFTDLNGFTFSFPAPTAEAQAEVEAVRAEVDALRAELALQQGEQGGVEEGTDTGAGAADSSRSLLRTSPANASVLQGMGQIDEALASLGPVLDSGGAGASSAPGAAVADVQKSLVNGGSPLEAKLLRIVRDPATFIRDMMDRAPYLMFVLVPTFALLLKLLYVRRRRLYLEHLIFALHVHALAFITFSVSAILGALDVGTSLNLDAWLAVAPFGYLFFAIRRVYGQSLGMVAVKTGALLVAYGIILVAALVLLVLGTVALM